MNRFTIRRAVLVVTSAASLALPVHADDGALESARQLYETCHWSQAFEAFAHLADNGNVEAARIASLMFRHGPALFNTSFSVPATRVARWQTAAATTLQASR